MKLVHPDFHFQISLPEASILGLIIESPAHFFHYANEFYSQIDGKDGRFVLSENGEILRMDKFLHFVENPFSLELNSKSIQTKLFALLKERIMTSDEIEAFYNINTSLVNMLEAASEAIPFPIQYEEPLDVTSLLKIMNIRLVTEETEQLAARLIDYLKIVSRLLGITSFVLINILPFLSKDDLVFIKETALHEKLALLFIDGYEKECYNFFDAKYIIDIDLCEIV